jgi:hypothetical protein
MKLEFSLLPLQFYGGHHNSGAFVCILPAVVGYPIPYSDPAGVTFSPFAWSRASGSGGFIINLGKHGIV